MTDGYKALVLRTCDADMISRNGFVWPVEGPVKCPDWNPKPECGNGLHGALWGEGYGGLFDWSPEAVWQVVGINEWVDLEGKVKFPEGVVLHTGDQKSATDYIRAHGAKGAVIGGTVTTGRHGTATAGDYGTVTAGDCGTATAGFRGTATAGYDGTAIAGEDGTATAGENGTATAGNYGTATAGNYGTAAAGHRGTAAAGPYGTATAGDRGTATAGRYGTATAGRYGTAAAGYRGTVTAGENGIIQILWYDSVQRKRIVVGYTGEDGIEADVRYGLDDDGKFVKA